MKKIGLIIISLISINISAQTNNEIDYSNPKTYELGGVVVNGANNLNNSTLIAISGLSVEIRFGFLEIRSQQQLINFGSKGYSQMSKLVLKK